MYKSYLRNSIDAPDIEPADLEIPEPFTGGNEFTDDGEISGSKNTI
ncbi:MAG TPA: hypothetical protein VK675_03570 [Candidatus Paceibacterota bacterium]|nr:hypothetical protein [Candidatus Paceibacterota bacterium]